MKIINIIIISFLLFGCSQDPSSEMTDSKDKDQLVGQVFRWVSQYYDHLDSLKDRNKYDNTELYVHLYYFSEDTIYVRWPRNRSIVFDTTGQGEYSEGMEKYYVDRIDKVSSEFISGQRIVIYNDNSGYDTINYSVRSDTLVLLQNVEYNVGEDRKNFNEYVNDFNYQDLFGLE